MTQIYNGIDTQRYRPKKGISTETVSGTEPKPVPGAELSSEPGAGITSDVAPGSGPGTETARAPVNEIGTGSGSGTKDCPKVIGVIGRLDPIKDHPTLFRAFAQVARSMPEIQLMVIGDGPERQKLESMAETLVEADIRFTGNRLDVPDLLRQITGKKARESVIRRFSMADMAAGYSGV